MQSDTCAVVNTIIYECGVKNPKIYCRPMKLQKVAYFCFGWCLAKLNRQLFSENFEAWPYGPVIPSVYHEFKGFGYRYIDRFAASSDGKSYRYIEEETNSELYKNLRIPIDNFCLWDDFALAELTHKKGTAWFECRVNEKKVIPVELIKKEFNRYE